MAKSPSVLPGGGSCAGSKGGKKLGQRMVTVTTKGKRLVMQPEGAGELYQEYSRPEYEEVQLQWIPLFCLGQQGRG